MSVQSHSSMSAANAMKTSPSLNPPLQILHRKVKEPKSIVEVRQYFVGMTPADVLCQAYLKVLARAHNMSGASFIQYATGLSRSQLRLGVQRQSTLDRAMQRRIANMRSQLRRKQWKPAEIAEFEAGFPSLRSDFPTAYADFTYAVFYGFGGGEEAISHAIEIDRLIWDLEHAYRDGMPPVQIGRILRDCSVFDAEHFNRPEGQLTADYSERQALAELAQTASWEEATPLIALIGVHCLISLLAIFDICIQRYLGPVWSDSIDGSVVTRLFPRLSPRAAVETGRPSRRGLVELPIALLLDFCVRLIYRWRNGQWPRKRPSWKEVACWTTSVSAGLLAQWRSGQKSMTAADFARFWLEASCTPKRQRRPPPIPMPLYFAAVMLETCCVTWKKRGQHRSVLLPDRDDYLAHRQRLMEASAMGASGQSA